jgi:hypothetical protein
MSATLPQGDAAVLLVDVVGSSGLEDFVSGRDRRIGQLNERHQARNWIAAPYTVTAWDEFQSVLWQLETIPLILLDIRRVFAPWEVYVAVGIGEVSGDRSRKPINEALSGAGFDRARQAMDALKSSKGDKYRRLTRFRSANPDRDAWLDLLYGLHDSLTQQITPRQWETISTALDLDNQEDVAAQLHVQPSTVTRNLKRGHFWQLRDTAETVSALLAGTALPGGNGGLP